MPRRPFETPVAYALRLTLKQNRLYVEQREVFIHLADQEQASVLAAQSTLDDAARFYREPPSPIELSLYPPETPKPEPT